MRPSLRQLQLLRLLVRAPKGTLVSGVLAERMHLSRAQLRVTLNALIGHGAVSVEPEGRDQVKVAITNYGRHVFTEADKIEVRSAE